VGTQALGALGAAGIKPFGQAGGMVREMPVKAQSGGALSSLMQRTQDLDTSPVVGMARGGDIMSFLSPAFGAGRAAKKGGIKGLATFLSPAFAMSQGKLPMGLSSIMGSDTPPPPPPPVISQEEIDKQIDAALRQRAAQGQQMASKGAGPAQVGSQVGQVRQAFKGGGGLRQMVQLPSNRVRFGKTAYQDVSSPLVEDTRELYEEYIGGPMRRGAEVGRLMYERPGPLTYGAEYAFGTRQGLEDIERQQAEYDKAISQITSIGAAPAALAAAAKDDASQVEGASELDAGIGEEPKAPKAKKTPAPDKKKKGEDLYRSPEEAAYASLIDSDAGQQAAKRYFAGENVTLANISEALKAYKGFKDTEMAQRRAINEANIKKAATARAARTAALKDADLLAGIAQKRDEPAQVRLKAATEGMKIAQATLDDTVLQSMAKSDPAAAAKIAKAEKMAAQFAGLVQRFSQESAEAQAIGGLAMPQSILGADPKVQEMIAGMIKGKG
jgi:hypothetical protein